MTNPRQHLTLGLLAVLVLAGTGAFAYFAFLQPIGEKEAAAAKLAQEADEQDAKLRVQRANMVRLEQARKRSLPADENVAAREYREILYQLARDAKAPGINVTPRSVDNKATVQGGQKVKPPYTRVAAEVVFKGDLWALVDFLKGYYRLNLLQQITAVTVKKAEESGSRRGGDAGDRRDLNVTLVTEALILDGAENRRSVLPVPRAFAALGGYGGYQAVAQSPEVGRRLTPMQVVPVLAAKPRDYTVLIAKDLFHGPLPKPAPKAELAAEPEEPPPPPKEDIAPFIRLVGVTLRGDGTAAAEIKDLANNSEYVVEFAPGRTRVEKFSGGPGRRQLDGRAKPSDLVVISDEASGTTRSYRVVGVESDALYVADSSGPPPAPRGLPALAGGPAAALAPGKVFRWQLGRALKDVSRATAEESRRALGAPAGDPVASVK